MRHVRQERAKGKNNFQLMGAGKRQLLRSRPQPRFQEADLHSNIGPLAELYNGILQP